MPGTAAVFLNQGDLGFGAPLRYSGEIYLEDVQVTDLDADSKPDIFFTGIMSGYILNASEQPLPSACNAP